jgi:concentrative nucleoside transporter, CNT family
VGLNLVSLLGLVVLGLIAWAAGGCRRPVPWRTVAGSGLLMLVLGALVFLWDPARRGLILVNDLIVAVLTASRAGAEFLFGPLALGPGESTAAGEPSVGFVLATQVLPAVIFFAALMAALYHLRLVQPLVRLFARLFRDTLRLSGAEALAGASNIFFGVESVAAVRPYLAAMTRSELLTMLSCGMATVASTTMALYVFFLKGSFPQIAGHLVSASVLSIPAAVLVSKLILPESGRPETLGALPPLAETGRHGNTLAALSAGAWDGLKLAAGIATLLIAVLGVVGIADALLGGLTRGLPGLAPAAHGAASAAGGAAAAGAGGGLSLERLLGWLFTPFAWIMGVEGADVGAAARLLGERILMTEVVAYRHLGQMAAAGSVTPRTLLLMSYALCGFSHVASVGIFVGGTAALAPSRRDDLAALGPRALLASTLATLMTGALAGVMYHGQQGILGL